MVIRVKNENVSSFLLSVSEAMAYMQLMSVTLLCFTFHSWKLKALFYSRPWSFLTL